MTQKYTIHLSYQLYYYYYYYLEKVSVVVYSQNSDIYITVTNYNSVSNYI